MIPIGDVNPRRSFPVATVGLIVVNALVLLYLGRQSPGAQEALYYQAGVIPYRLVNQLDAGAAFTLLTAMFVHGGWGHLLSNVLFLWVFGDNIEDRLGVLLFLVAYLLTGIVATLAQVVMDPQSRVPIVGASGAISGIAGTYLVLFPRARVRVLVPVFLFVRVFEVSALSFFVLWFGMQALMALGSLGAMAQGGVAWFAHLGGFVAGIVLGLLARSLQGGSGSSGVGRGFGAY